jgi:hypothetical protein
MKRSIIQAALVVASLAAITGCGGGGGGYNIDAGPGTDSDTDSDVDTDTDTDSDSDVDTDTDTDTDTDADSDTDTDVDTDTDSDTDTDTDTDSDTDSDGDTDTGSDTETDTFVALCSGPGVWLDEGWWTDPDSDSEIDSGDFGWPGTRCWEDPPAPTTMNWDAAVAYCDDLVLAGYDDWVLPNVNELQALGRPNTWDCAGCGLHDPSDLTELDTVDCEPCIPTFGGPGAGGCYWPPELAEVGCDTPNYWSSSELFASDWKAWMWLFYGNYPGATDFPDDTVPCPWKTSLAAVRCVRPL